MRRERETLAACLLPNAYFPGSAPSKAYAPLRIGFLLALENGYLVRDTADLDIKSQISVDFYIFSNKPLFNQ